eukprot:INCI452.1.p1 GENE.INCI452.1~~INCI452.1.p1  ORF type:complete len:1840 (-),score=337.03 INCI452.1:806-6325(-)
MSRNDKVHPAPVDMARGAGGGIKEEKFVEPETKSTGPASRGEKRLGKRSSTIKRLTSSQANSEILKRFQTVELEEGMLVEFVKDPTKPNQKELCEIMLINDGEPPTYNLRLCSSANTIYEDKLEMSSVEMFKDGAVRTFTQPVISRYNPLGAGHKVQVLVQHPGALRKDPKAEAAWYNAEIMSVSHSEVHGVLYEVQLSHGHDENSETPMQGVCYEQLREKPAPDFEVGDEVEARIDGKGDNPFFPAKIVDVVTETSVAGGILYDVDYVDLQIDPKSTKVIRGKPTRARLSPFDVRARFAPSADGKKSYAEYCKGNEGWLPCRIDEVLANGAYHVNVEDGEPDTVVARPIDLRLFLAVGECAMRKRDGRPVTIVKVDGEGKDQKFEVDVHLEGDMQRVILTRTEIESITLAELQYFGIENAQNTAHLTTKKQRDEIIDLIEDISAKKRNGPFVWPSHAVDDATGESIHHSDHVFAVAYTRDGDFFVTGDIRGHIMLRDGVTGRCLNTDFYSYGGKSNPWIVNLVFNNDNTQLAVCLLSGVVLLGVGRESRDGRPMLVRTNTTTVTADVHQGGCLTCDFAPDRPDLLVSGGFDGTIMFWLVRNGAAKQVEQHDVCGDPNALTAPTVNMVRFSPRGLWLAVAAGDGNCYLHCLNKTDGPNGEVQLQLRDADRVVLAHGHSDEVTCVDYCNGDEGLVVTGGKDNNVVVWSSTNGDMLARLTDGHVRDITCVTFDPSNKFVVSSADDRRIVIWDAVTAEKVGILLGRHTSAVNRVIFRPNKPDEENAASILVSVGNDERVLMWRPGGLRWRRITKPDNNRHNQKRKDFKPIRTIACHPSQEWVIFSESCDGRVMSTAQPIWFKNKETTFLAKMDGSPVFCGSNPLTRRCATPAPAGWIRGKGNKKYEASSRLVFSDFSKGKYKDGWICQGVPDKATGKTECEKDFPGRRHPASEMRFFCMDCGYNICIACSGVDGHSMNVTSVDISSDGTFACSVADDATCIVWDIKTLRFADENSKDKYQVVPYYRDEKNQPAVSLSSFKYHKRAVESVRIAPSDLHFVTSSKTEFMSLVWEFDRIRPNKHPLYILEGGVGADFVDRTAVVTADKHFIRLYELEISVASGQADRVEGRTQASAEPVDFFQDNEGRAESCHEFRVDKLGSVTTLAVCSKIFKNFCAIGDSFGSVQILGLGTVAKREVYEIPGAKWRHHADQITCMAFNSSGHNLATGSSDMTVRIYSIRVHGSKAELNRTGVRRVTADICYMSTGGLNPFPKIDQHPAELGLQVQSDAEFVGHMAPVCSVAFSATGSELYSGDQAGHIIQWWWRADPHVDFSIAALSKDNTLNCVTEWMNLLQAAFTFPRIGFEIDLALCNTVDIDTSVQLLTMIMSKNCFAGTNRDSLFAKLFFAETSDAVDSSHRFLAGSIAGGTNSIPSMKLRNGVEGSQSPLEIIFNGNNQQEQVDNIKYGTTMLNYWLAMGRSAMYDPSDAGTPELLVNFLQISTAVSKILPMLAEHKIELAIDVMQKWSHEGLSLVMNPYAAYLTSETSPHQFKKLFASGAGSGDEVLDILPDSSATPFGESLLSVQAQDFLNDRTYKQATDAMTFRTEDYRFHVSPVVRAGFVPVVPCVFSLPHHSSRPISESLLHILVSNEELFDVVFDEKANSEFKASPGIAVLVNFKWRQYARREYMAQFFTYLTQYICFSVFCYGLVLERQYYSGPPCNVFSEASVNGDWNMTDIGCINLADPLDFFPTTPDVGMSQRDLFFYTLLGAVTLFFSLYHLVMLIVQNRDQDCKSFFFGKYQQELSRPQRVHHDGRDCRVLLCSNGASGCGWVCHVCPCRLEVHA